MKQLKQLGKDSIVYGLGGVVAKGISFFLLPVYTRIFAPADYGTMEMLTVLSSFLSSIMVMGMDSTQSFYFFKQKDKGIKSQARVVTAIVQWRLIWGGGSVILATLFSPVLNSFFFHGQLNWHFFAIAFSASLFAQIMSQSAEVFRLLYNPIKYLSITVAHTIVTAVVSLTLIVGFDKGVMGFFWGALIGSAGTAIWGWFLIRKYIDWTGWHFDLWPRLLKFGAPLVPAGFAMYILNTSDRWFITSYKGPDELGLYAVGAKFAMMMSLAVQTFRLAWWPVAMEAMQSEDGKLLFRTVARLYMGGSICGIVFLTALSPLFVDLLAAPKFFKAYPIVGVLGWYPVFYGFYLIGSCGIWKAEKTSLAPLLMGGSAVLNIALNWLWVPRYGSMGAAVATSVSFLSWNVFSLYVSEQLWRVGYQYFRMLCQIFIGAVCCGLILYAYQFDINYGQGLAVAGLSVFLLGITTMTRNDITKIWEKTS